MRRSVFLVATLGCLLSLAACAAPAPETGEDALAKPPVGVFDYQLGGAYDPAQDVRMVVRDRTAQPDAARYSICYINAFQTQPGERDSWPADVLLTRGGEPVIDPDWPDEVILDTSSPTTRAVIVDTVSEWVRGCAASGFRAIEFDNLDTFTRTDGALTLDDNRSLARELVAVAHDAGLAAGQKNAAEYAAPLHEVGFDFAVAEECAAFWECGAYTEVYGDAVFDVEYTDQLPRPFAEMCADADTPASTILRDRDLEAPGDPAHVFASCVSA